ncbi:MAG TPA: SDR family NAD(P)-dependent oxidoreductase [Microbacteriaceae bacterium]|nr:SDR family NAD(P)-dependent oxidoreductase [Microbacteriaceae bacterium]
MTDISYDFTGRTALVTGSGSGIGRATALALGAVGANVAVADISATAGAETVELIRAAGGTAEFFPVDVADFASVEAMVAAVVARFGGLDIAHNNAGVEGEHVPLGDIRTDDWKRVIDIDLNAVYYCIKAEVAVMAERGGGSIINTSSVSGLIAGYNLGAYTAAKHGVIGLTKSAAIDHAKDGIRVNAICPGLIDTPFIHELPQIALDRIMLGTPMSRLGQPGEIAKGVLWLASSGSSYVTGTALSIDGGTVALSAGTNFNDLDL